MPPFRCPRWLILLGAALVLLTQIPGADAQPPLREEPEKILGFAHHLLSEGDAYRAVTEYRAFLFLFPGHAKEEEARFFLGKAHQKERDWSEALEAFRQAAEGKEGNGSWAWEAALEYGETLLLAGQPAAAAKTLEEVADTPRWDRIRGRALYRAAWGWLQAREWEQAIRTLERIPPDDPLRKAAEQRREEIAREVPSLPQRDPWLAGGLAAILPGSGHMYSGRVKEGLTSFLLNGAFVAGAVFSVREGYLVTAGILSFFELGWYLGGISTAAREAEQFNREQEHRWLMREEERWEPRPQGMSPSHTGPIVRWQWRF